MAIINIITKSYISYTRGEKKISPWAVLKPLGWGGAAIVYLRRALYDHGIYSSQEAPLPVISVGNLTTGGTNKTPFVEYIAQHLCDAGLKPGIISRGYGGKTPAPVVMVDGNAPRDIVGDEPLLLSRHLPRVPIAVSRDRVADVKALLNYPTPAPDRKNIPSGKNAPQGQKCDLARNAAVAGESAVDIVIADDAFQHRRLARECDIVLLDPICPFGNGSVLPSGILRELPSSLERAHIVVITKADQATPEQLDNLTEKISRWVPRDRIFLSRLAEAQWAEWDGENLRAPSENFLNNSYISEDKTLTPAEKCDGQNLRAPSENLLNNSYISEDKALTHAEKCDGQNLRAPSENLLNNSYISEDKALAPVQNRGCENPRADSRNGTDTSVTHEDRLLISRAKGEGKGPFTRGGAAFAPRVLLFSAIGSPRSFRDTVERAGLRVHDQISFKDHHHYRLADLRELERRAQTAGNVALCCTEKDLYNLPHGYRPSRPLLVPRISIRIDDEERFWHTLTETLRPHILIASNGNGEDAIGARLACEIRRAFPASLVEAFPLVGRGEAYKHCDIPVDAPYLNSPTGGIIKYHFKDLLQELRVGLLHHIAAQFRKWKKIRTRIRTVLCVGDAYLLCHTILGQGKKALLIATAKTQLISGHWRLESTIYRRACLRVWTRDEQTAAQLRSRGVPAHFDGNPIMDLRNTTQKVHLWGPGRRILILPGSRSRAYTDIQLLLSALLLLSAQTEISAVLVVAHTLSLQKLIESARGWTYDGQKLKKGKLQVKIYCGEASDPAEGAELLLGLGGTANQVCAGMGIPVLSILEKGKLVQKKLLGDAELLVPPRPEQLAQAAARLLNDPRRLASMSQAGRARLGRSGSLAAVIQYAADRLGWAKKCAAYEKLKSAPERATTSRAS